MSVEDPQPRKASIFDVKAITATLACAFIIGSVLLYSQVQSNAQTLIEMKEAENLARKAIYREMAKDREAFTLALNKVASSIQELADESRHKEGQLTCRQGYMNYNDARVMALENKVGIVSPPQYRCEGI